MKTNKLAFEQTHSDAMPPAGGRRKDYSRLSAMLWEENKKVSKGLDKYWMGRYYNTVVSES